MSIFMRGGCAVPERGKAAQEREKMKVNKENNKKKYVALSACVHCRKFDCEPDTCKAYLRAKKLGYL